MEGVVADPLAFLADKATHLDPSVLLDLFFVTTSLFFVFVSIYDQSDTIP